MSDYITGCVYFDGNYYCQNYSHLVAIRNSCKATSLHTWLVFGSGDPLSVMPPNNGCALSGGCPVKLEKASKVGGRRHEDEIVFLITEDQFRRMRHTIIVLSNRAKYVLSPGDGAESME